MKTAIHNIEPKTPAERVAAFQAQIEGLAAIVRNTLSGKPAKPESIANRYTAPAGDDDAAPAKNKGAVTGFTAPKGDD